MKNPDKLEGRKTLHVNGILEEFEKDEVKKRVDIVSLFASFGVELKAKGKGYMGLCPWHEDSNPSLSVDREKGLYNCFGCGESGDAVSLVEKMRGVGFREAVTYLKAGQFVAAATPKPSGAPSAAASASASTDAKPPIDTARLLADVAARYEKALAESKEARAYLEGRGLWVPEALKRFRVGFCSGGLAGVVSEEQRAELVALGLLKKGGNEHFEACVTVPQFDDAGHVVGFYGRRIDGGTPVHLYLPGPHKGLVNREAAKAYRDRLVLTEAVLDALSLEALGTHNAIPCYGANGFTAEHERLLLNERVKEVVVAFDVDEAGEKGSKTVIERLLKIGIKAFSVKPSKGNGSTAAIAVTKDWNEFLVAGGTKEEVEEAIEKALADFNTTPEVSESVSETSGVKLSPKFDELVMAKEAGRHTFTREGVRYRMQGARESFSASLRVSLRTEALSEDGAPVARGFVDSVDLYSARSRSAYSLQCSGAFSGVLEAARIERDLLSMLDLLEAERDARLNASEDGPRVPTPEEARAGMELLVDPKIAERVVADLATVGYVGEDVNKLLVYLAATSRKMPDPISVIVSSQSASGKSYLIDTVKALMPEEDVVSMTSLSDQALNYLPDDALMHKFLVMGEAVHAESVEHQIREMLSARELSRLVTLKDEKTGELSSRTVRKKVVVALAMSTTKADMNPENASRCFMLSTDESEAQTKAVHEAQRGKYTRERRAVKKETLPAILRSHHAAQRLLERVAIVNPYAHLLDFPARLMRTRRDHERFLDLIASVCFLRQFQKQKKEDEHGSVYVECDLTDYEIAYTIMMAILPGTLTGFPRAAFDLYKEIRRLATEKAEREELSIAEVELTQREIRDGTGLGQMTVKRGVRTLCDYEYLLERSVVRRGYTKSYRLTGDEGLSLVDVSSIPAPEVLEELMRKTGGAV